MAQIEGGTETASHATAVNDSRMTFAYVVALLLLVACAVFVYVGVQGVFSSNDWLTHTYQVINRLEGAFSEELDAESSQRGYVLTGQQVYLDRYKASVKLANDAVDHVHNLTIDNPRQQSAATELKRLIALKSDEMALIVRSRDLQGMAVAQKRISLGAGRIYMEQVRAEIDSMESEEKRLLGKRQQASQRSSSIAVVAFGISTIAGISLLTVLYTIARRLFQTLADARATDSRYRRRLEEEIGRTEQARKELERSNRELQDFAFVASHDLQEPLRKIRSFGDRLRMRNKDILDETSDRDLGRMQNAAERMQGLINDILTLSRVTSKAQPFAKVGLNKVCDEVLDDLETRIAETGATVTRGNLPSLKADAVQMRQLLQNLIGNALKFRKPDGQPQVSIDPINDAPHGRVGFEVRDNGIGFEQRHAEKIFTVFQRLHGRDQYEGSGVGLSICRKIVERHQGSIEVLSEPGVGTTFKVILPSVTPQEL